MLRIRYSADSGVDLEATLEELQAIREGILELTRTGAGSRTFAGTTTGSPAPYATWLRRLVVRIAEGPTRVSVFGGGVLHVSGDAECLAALASFFRVPADARAGWHSHHEYYEGNRWVAADSEPLCIELEGPSERR